MKKLIIAVFLLLLTISSGFAQETVSVQVLTKGSSSWDGNPVSYSQGQPELSIVKINIPFDVQLPLHCHPTPLAAYVTKGRLEVIKKSGKKKVFSAGDAFIEVMNSWHKGKGLADDTELIVFYAGTKDIPLTIKPDNEKTDTQLCR